jgi:hypothetical protein
MNTPRDLIGLTPGERDTAAAVLRSFMGRGWVGGWDRAGEAVDALVAAVNEHRTRCNAIADRHNVGKPRRAVR